MSIPGFVQFGSSAAIYNSAADPVSPPVTIDADPETVGWGSTTVGTLLRAKVRCCVFLAKSTSCE